MTVDLNQTTIALDPGDHITFSGQEYVDLFKDSQGNIVHSHGRDYTTHLLLEFDTTNVAAVRDWIVNAVLPQVTSAYALYQQILAHRATGVDGGLFVNFALSALGYSALGIEGAAVPDDPSFLRGAKTPNPDKSRLPMNDPPVGEWEQGFQQPIHALLLLADDDPAALAAGVDAAKTAMAGAATVVDEQQGETLRNDLNEPIEHFGFADGVSQPLFMLDDIEEARQNGGFDRWDPSAALGLVLLKDPGGGPAGHGSYLVYRKLSQDVASFDKQVAELQTKLPKTADPELAGAYVVGRFKDGTPVVQQPKPGWINEPLNFDYSADAEGMRCPFAAHIRQANPRDDKAREFGLPPEESRMRRIARRAVPYPPGAKAGEPTDGVDVGLLFLCVQSSIVHQFEFIQTTWANFTDFLRPATGLDTVIGQGDPSAVPQSFPVDWGDRRSTGNDPTFTFDFTPWVTMRGGEYFFLPSLSFLAGVATTS